MVKRKCLQCNKEFLIYSSEIKRGCGKYCSQVCYHISRIGKESPKGMLGKKHSPETRKKIGNIHRGKKLSEETKQKLREASLGRKHTKETKKKMSITHKKIGTRPPVFSGEAHYLYIKENREQYLIKKRINDSVRKNIRHSLKRALMGKSWERLVGYTVQDLINRLSVNFKEGMSLQNYGKWHIDHIKPISLFNFNSYEDQAFKDCWALANLQPLWAAENIRKNNKFIRIA